MIESIRKQYEFRVGNVYMKVSDQTGFMDSIKYLRNELLKYNSNINFNNNWKIKILSLFDHNIGQNCGSGSSKIHIINLKN